MKNYKQWVLEISLVLTALLVASQKGQINNSRRWLLLLGVTVCGMVYVAIPWERVQKQLDMNRLLSRVLLLLSPFFAFYFVQICGGFTDRQFAKLLFSTKGRCNLLLYFALGYFLYLLCNRAKWAAVLLVLLSLVFGLANYFVVEFRDSPILAADIGSIGTAADVAGGYVYRLNPDAFKAVVLAIIFCCVALRQKSYRWLGWKKRLVLLAGGAVVFGGLNSQILSGAYFQKNGISLNIWDPGSNYVKNGSLVSLAVSYSYYHVGKPEGYSPAAAGALAAAYLPQENRGTEGIPDGGGTAGQPNVIVIMNEAFSDLSVLGKLEVSAKVLPFVEELRENTVKGKLYMSVRSSQTANSEFEFLTGCSMAFLPYRSIPYNSYIKSEIPTLTTALKEQGYGKNLALHPGMPDAWNRSRVYPLFGFEEFHAVGEVEAWMRDNADAQEAGSPGTAMQEDMIHGFISDAGGYRYLINQYEEFRAGFTAPFYTFFVTIQNHSGYSKNPVEVQISLENKEAWSEETEQYLNLIRISDEALKGLVEYFAQVEEPTVIVLFGDHQPGLSPRDSAKTYTSDLALYEVPYLIWANYDIQEEERDMSVNYLSAYLLKVIGAKRTGFQNYLLDLQERVPVITANGYVGDNGQLYGWEEASPYKDLLNEYRILQYNDLFDTKNRVEEFFHLDTEQ